MTAHKPGKLLWVWGGSEIRQSEHEYILTKKRLLFQILAPSLLQELEIPEYNIQPPLSGVYKGKEQKLQFVLLKAEGPLMQNKLLFPEAETAVKK